MRKTKEKTKVLWISLAIVLFAASCIIYVPRQEEYPPPERETYREREYRTYRQETDIAYFYEYLSPYGTWVYYSPHGY
ncbi:MAG: hypothetical protein FJY81_07180, partial [Candidatus Aminicenantes bacterium]|nr:hypothetical protein [Candidatus Aminicenantes bacterium]